MDPIILFFILGFASGAFKSELKLPPAIYDFLTIILLLSVGLKGGEELATYPFLVLIPKFVIVMSLGLFLPVIAFSLLRSIGKMNRPDAASIAAHYGSVSVGTFAVAVAFLATKQVFFESYLTLFLVALEIPAIIIGIILAKGISKDTHWGALFSEIFRGKSIVLLVGGLLIGWITGPTNIIPIKILFFDMFKGILALFLLEMGLLASTQLTSLKKNAVLIILFGILMPLFSASIGILMGKLIGLSLGGTTLLAVLAGSASYIAVPAAMRIAVPESNASLSLTASLGVTFPFNVLLGIPLYYWLAQYLFSIL